MHHFFYLAVASLLAVACNQNSDVSPDPKPVSEMNSKKSPPRTMNKKNTGIYSGRVVTKFASDGYHFRLSMGDFKLVIPDEVAKGRDIADYVEKMISVKGTTKGQEFIVSEWLD